MTRPDRIITADRCPAVLADPYRPRLAAIVAAHIAGQPAPVPDWRCVRTAHTMGPTDSHLAMPLGPTGRSVWFPADQEQAPAPELPDADVPVDVYATGPEHTPAPADPTAALAGLVERLARVSGVAVRCEPGDTLLLLVPDADQDMVDAADYAKHLGELLPGIAVVVLAGVAGGVVVPPPPADPVHPFAGETGELCRVEFGERRCALPETAVEHQYPPAPDRRYVPVDGLLTCRAGCAQQFTSAIARGRHEGPTGPHMMRRP